MTSELFHFQLGRFSCISILDCRTVYPAELFFANVPRERLEVMVRDYTSNVQEFELCFICLYIETISNRVLIDTGMGPEGLGVQGKLIERLRSAGIQPDDIDTVILSHGHDDHTGGNTDHEGRPVFRNARYVMHRQEWDYWMSNPSLSELPINQDFKEAILGGIRKHILPIRDRFEVVAGDAEVVPGITIMPTYGHTPGHVALDIASEDRHLFFIGDSIIHPVQIEHPETISVFDHQPETMIATRLALRRRAAEEESMVMASHFPFPGLGYIRNQSNHWKWQPISLES
jgi:glyoxylase-like metal-dependent hydrolase (beta-lactamase superfamily II)